MTSSCDFDDVIAHAGVPHKKIKMAESDTEVEEVISAATLAKL